MNIHNARQTARAGAAKTHLSDIYLRTTQRYRYNYDEETWSVGYGEQVEHEDPLSDRLRVCGMCHRLRNLVDHRQYSNLNRTPAVDYTFSA